MAAALIALGALLIVSGLAMVAPWAAVSAAGLLILLAGVDLSRGEQ